MYQNSAFLLNLIVRLSDRQLPASQKHATGPEAKHSSDAQKPCSLLWVASADVDAQAPLRVVNSVAEHQAKRARSAQADASTAKPRGRPATNPHPISRPPSNPTQAASSTATPRPTTSRLDAPAAQITSSPASHAPAGDAAMTDQAAKRKNPPSVLASIVVSMDEGSGMNAGQGQQLPQQLQQAAQARHPVADGWSLPAGLYPTHPSSGGPAEDPMKARLESHGQAGPRMSTAHLSPTCMQSRGSPPKQAKAKVRQPIARDGVTAKITSGRGRGHKAHNRWAYIIRLKLCSRRRGHQLFMSIYVVPSRIQHRGSSFLSYCSSG